MRGWYALTVALAALLLPAPILASDASADEIEEGYYSAEEGEEVVREVLKGHGLLSTLRKVTGRRGNDNVTVASVLFIGRDDGVSNELISELFDFVDRTPAQSQVAIAPIGDAGGNEQGEKQSLAVITNQESEDLITSSSFLSVARDVAVSFAVAGDVIHPIHFTDLLRGEFNFALLQIALEHYLHFQARGLISKRPKRLHLLVLGVDEAEARELGLTETLEAQVAALWDRIIKPDGYGGGDEEGGEGGLASEVAVQVSVLPNPLHAPDGFKESINHLKASLDAELSTPLPFVTAKTLEGAVAALLPLSSEFLVRGGGGKAARLPKEDTVVSAFLLDKLVYRFVGQFRQDGRRLFDVERGYNEEFSKTYDELIDKYLLGFQQEVYGMDAGGVNTYLQGLDAGQVAAVVRAKKAKLRQLLLSSVEPAYRKQLEFLRKLSLDEFRKSLSSLKYNWELVPGLAKGAKTARALFREGAARQVCRGAKWTYSGELATLTKAMEDQTNDILEAQRARGVYVPEKLRRPIGVQVNWLGPNFFHFLQDSSCDPLSIRTDSGVCRTIVENDFDPMERYGIDPQYLDYMRTKPKTDLTAPLKFGWTKRIAFEPITQSRNLDDMTYQFIMPKHIASY